jgi:L-2,4-diaminobutyrate decarboxylase
MIARSIGYDPEQAGGMLNVDGTGPTMHGIKLGLSKAFLGSMEHRIREAAVVLASESRHDCRGNIIGLLGSGAKKNHDPSNPRPQCGGSQGAPSAGYTCLKAGQKMGGGNGWLWGGWYSGNYDVTGPICTGDFTALSSPYSDGVIGWAWSVFNDYLFRLIR